MTASQTTLRLIDGLNFRGRTGSGHEISLDSRVEADGPASGPSPMELQLLALGGCGAMDTLSILRKMRQEVGSYEVRLTHERAAEHPRVFTAITITHVLTGDLSEAMVRRAIGLTMARYCPVFAMLAPAVVIRELYEIAGIGLADAVVRGEVTLAEARDMATETSGTS